MEGLVQRDVTRARPRYVVGQSTLNGIVSRAPAFVGEQSADDLNMLRRQRPL